jgi:hypothetical protein
VPELTWGINRWVLVDGPAGSLQRQVSSPHELADLLADAGVRAEEAERLAETYWHERPRDAGFETARRGEAMWRSTGLPAWAILLVVLGVVALYVLFRLREIV